MNYLEWSKKLDYHFFNDNTKNQEVVLYTDGHLLNSLYNGAGGEEDFLKIFDPYKILLECNPKPHNNLSKRDRITFFDKFNSLEHLLNYLIEEPRASFKICNERLDSSNRISYLPFILLLIYAYGKKDGVLNERDEKKMLGSDQKFRAYTFDLLLRLKESLKNLYTINVHNIYEITKGPNKYVGVFLYHSLFSQKHIIAIQEIIRRQHITRPIYNDDEILIRFEKIDRIVVKTIAPAKLIINKIIEGSLYANELKAFESKIKREIQSEIVLYPQIKIGDGDIITQYSLRPNLQTRLSYPETIFLNINEKEIETTNQEVGWYRSIIIEKFENVRIVKNGISVYSLLNTDTMFFQQLGEVFSEFQTDSNFFIYTEKPRALKKTIFIGNLENRKKIKSFLKNIDYSENENSITFSSVPYDFVFDKGKINKINSQSSIIKLEFFGGYRIKKTGHDEIYPYFFLPKLNFDLTDNICLQIKHQTIFNNEFQIDRININDNIVFENKNIEYGMYAIELNDYLKYKNLDEKNIFCIIAQLVNDNNEVLREVKLTIIKEFSQPNLTSNNDNSRSHIIQIGIVPNTEVVDCEKLKDISKEDYITRIIATAVYANNVELNSINLEKIIATSRYRKKIFLKGDEFTNSSQTIKNLRALGYIKVAEQENIHNSYVDEYVFKASDLALVQTSYNPQFYSRNFFLSGLRSFEFIEALCEILKPLIECNQVKISIKNEFSSLSNGLPPEIYLSFRLDTNVDEFLNSEINISGINRSLRTLIKVIPYNKNALAELKKIEVSNLNGLVLTTNLSDLVLNIMDECITIVKGENDNFTLLKGKNTSNVFIGKGTDIANYKLINTNLGYILAYASNQIPYIFSEHLGNSNVGVPKPIYVNTGVKLPQDIYSKLVYLNGGLPSKHKMQAIAEAEIFVHNTPNTFDFIATSCLPSDEVDYFKFDIDLNQRKQLEDILSTKIIYIQNAQFVNI
jgi:hypothetical protein